MILTQVLEALTHLSRHKVAHRDLKTDNILVQNTKEETISVVVSDFGCCWANKSYGFKCPYLTEDIDKGNKNANVL